MTVEEMASLIEFQKQQIADLIIERDRLKAESTNSSEALSISNNANSELVTQYNDAIQALEMFGINNNITQEEQIDVG